MSGPRQVPQHWDQSSKVIECLILFMIPAFLIRPIFPELGFALAFGLPALYLKLTVGKPDGYLFHEAYALGLPMVGLLPRRIKRLRR